VTLHHVASDLTAQHYVDLIDNVKQKQSKPDILVSEIDCESSHPEDQSNSLIGNYDQTEIAH
jgi:hypothetical protein